MQNRKRCINIENKPVVNKGKRERVGTNYGVGDNRYKLYMIDKQEV